MKIPAKILRSQFDEAMHLAAHLFSFHAIARSNPSPILPKH